MTDWWPASPGNVPLLGVLCSPVPMGSIIDRRIMEIPNTTAVTGKYKGHLGTVLGLKLTAWKSLINNMSRWGEVAAVVPTTTQKEQFQGKIFI